VRGARSDPTLLRQSILHDDVDFFACLNSRIFGFGFHLLAKEGDIHDDCSGEHKDDCVGTEA
jgi:hypothetical protein